MPCIGIQHAANPALVFYFESWRILRPVFAPIVDLGRADFGMSEPRLDLSDVGLMLRGHWWLRLS
ncbi:hypothetical protein ALP25_102379 [Pseudomonas syringae pv. syringae]|uniref:Uncharacterized protein n=1 Tax=Pseudomonas amygdali pv. morsprunorum TaxID=129138 RepID=A0A3M2W9I4_PSEA0|nr:hypothetical protein ALQ94_102572 [Pseudomonas amygdali pv. morsprunorum]RMU63644.1 hypothetical protein ALP25_102379 [Pseudomonas syringae pv. syringae]